MSRLTALLLALTLPLLLAHPVRAQVALIQDAEIETMVMGLARPLLQAAGMDPSRMRVRLVNDRRFNAFVDGSNAIYVNTGTIMDIERPRELKAILAHEIGHLAGGHIERLKTQADVANNIRGITMLLGVGLLAASAAADGSQMLGGAAQTMILAGNAAATNNFLAYRQEEESSADRLAVRYLSDAGQPTIGLIEILEEMHARQGARAASAGYIQTHPLAQDRINSVSQLARSSPSYDRADTAAERSALAFSQAKLIGYLESAASVQARYPNSDTSLPARYARVIAGYRAGAGPGAIVAMGNLLQADPTNPYFNELYGQMYLETGQPEKSLAPLRRALDLAGDQIAIRLLYGHALVEAGGRANLEEAVSQMGRATRDPNRTPRAFALLSRAHAGLGNEGEADLAAAEAAFLSGDKGLARGLANKAQQKLNRDSPGWLRADDILAITS